ncbi:hypothetical protein [Arthrobacter sp. KK5.5]|uniref:hypothetical protein n=1 Tax=Arthrobacter sp. KK5.5 TaxID=3373084 RepID=UPI003EE57F5F
MKDVTNRQTGPGADAWENPQGGASAVDTAVSHLEGLSDLKRRDIGAAELRKSLASGELVRVRHGVYLPGADVARLAPWEKDVVSLHAQARSARGQTVFGFASAARLWGLDVWGVDRNLHVVQRASVGSRVFGQRVVSHNSMLTGAHVGRSQGLSLTGIERTVTDCLMTMPFLSAVILADSALRGGLQRSKVAEMLDARPKARGVRRGRTALEFADGRSESVAEGRLRVLLHQWGMPPPVLQWEVQTRRGLFRPDFAWPEFRLAIETHGNGKYFMESPTNQKLIQERKREAALAEEGIRVLNIWWDQLDESGLRGRVTAHLASARDAFRQVA